MEQTPIVLTGSRQDVLDAILDLDPRSWGAPRTPVAARCPSCGKAYRSAPWIAIRRALRHARRIHGLRLRRWHVEVRGEG